MASGEKKFSEVESAIMYIIAIIFDVVSFIPGVNIISGIIGWAIVYSIFFIKGVSFTRNGIAGKSLLLFVVGLIPGLSVLPEFTFAMFLNIRAINKGESLKSKKEEEESKDDKPSRIERMTNAGQNASTPGVPNVMNRATLQNDAMTTTSSTGAGRQSNALQFGRENPTTFTVSSSGFASGGINMSGDGSRTSPLPKAVTKVAGKTAVVTGAVAEKTGQVVKNTGKAVQYTGKSVEYTGKAVQGVGKTAEYTGKAVEGIGKGVAAGGSATMRAGAAMSGTGVGAIVGVPVAAVGAVAVAAGKVTEATGAVTSAAGKATAQVGKATADIGQKTAEAGKRTRKFGEDVEDMGGGMKEEGKEMQKDGYGDTTADM